MINACISNKRNLIDGRGIGSKFKLLTEKSHLKKRKLLCYKSVHKLLTGCVRTFCFKYVRTSC